MPNIFPVAMADGLVASSFSIMSELGRWFSVSLMKVFLSFFYEHISTSITYFSHSSRVAEFFSVTYGDH